MSKMKKSDESSTGDENDNSNQNDGEEKKSLQTVLAIHLIRSRAMAPAVMVARILPTTRVSRMLNLILKPERNPMQLVALSLATPEVTRGANHRIRRVRLHMTMEAGKLKKEKPAIHSERIIHFDQD
ncbi:hypothetical protein ACFS07_32980 [Undibacterium arcticum]